MNPFTSGTLNKFLGQLRSFHCFPVFILSLFRYLFILKIFTDLFNPSPAVQFLRSNCLTLVWMFSLNLLLLVSVGFTGSESSSAPPWLWPGLGVVVPRPMLMIWFATLQCTVSPPSRADAKQLITTSATRSCRAINHPQSGSAQMEQPPLGMDKLTKAGGGWLAIGGVHLCPQPQTLSYLVPPRSAVLAHSPSDSSVNTAHSLLTSGPSPAAPFNCLY